MNLQLDKSAYKISVIIPCFNRELELKRAINSVLRQTLLPAEIIIVDDYSKDNIEKVVQSYENDRIKYFRLPQKANANVARNKGVAIAVGDFIAFLDSDDEYLPQHLEDSMMHLQNKQCDGVYAGIRINREKEITEVLPKVKKTSDTGADYILSGGLCSTPTFVIQKQCFEKVKFDENLERHQDWDFAIRMFKFFTFNAIETVHVLVHWPIKNHRKINLSASRHFIAKHINSISPVNHLRYHRNAYHAAVDQKSSNEIIKYYKQQCFRYKEVVDVTHFMSIFRPGNSVTKKILIRIRYILFRLLSIV